MEGRTGEDIIEKLGQGSLRKWEELNQDCLANIFGRVGLESLIWSLPFVCKNWYSASLVPHCWMCLDFCDFIDSKFDTFFFAAYDTPFEAVMIWVHNFPLRKLVKFSVDRSQGIATKVVLPVMCRDFEDVITCISNGCPMLKSLVLDCNFIGEDNMGCISKLIKNWKNLEQLMLPCDSHFKDIISEVSIHCKNFASLSTDKDITDEAATAIVTFLPNIRCLNLRRSTLDRKNLARILSQCKCLELLDASHCKGFDASDAEILQMASHIQTFLSDGSGVQIEDDDYDFRCVYYEWS